MKTCQVCLKTKEYDCFYDNITMKDGYTNSCKTCLKKYNRIKMREYRQRQKKNAYPFIYHPLKPRVNPPDPNNLIVQSESVRVTFE